MGRWTVRSRYKNQPRGLGKAQTPARSCPVLPSGRVCWDAQCGWACPGVSDVHGDRRCCRVCRTRTVCSRALAWCCTNDSLSAQWVRFDDTPGGEELPQLQMEGSDWSFSGGALPGASTATVLFLEPAELGLWVKHLRPHCRLPLPRVLTTSGSPAAELAADGGLSRLPAVLGRLAEH